MSEILMAPFVGAFFTVAVYLILSKSVIRMLLGIAILGNGVNLLIFIMGRVTPEIPPIVPNGLQQPIGEIANPLPQALILTAIVIGFALFTFLLVLGYRAYQELDADNTDNMRLAEPENPPQPPLNY